MSEVEFELRKLGDLIEIFNNKRVPLSAKQREGLEKIYPYYGAQGIVDYVDDYIFDGKYILIAEDGENLKSNNKSICTLATGKYWVNNHAHIIKGNEGTNTDFLYYKLNSINFAPYITGSAQPKLNKENLLNIELYIPSKEHQDKMAKVLTLLDQKIQINNQINQELEAMAKTLYDYWFVQFDFPDQNGKPYKSSGGKMVYNPELKREIPEGWGVTTFSSWISDNKTGDWGKETSQGNYTLEVDCIRGADINGLSGNGKTDMPTRFILEKNKNKLLTDFDIVIEISGGSPTQSTGRIVGISEKVLNRFDLPLICSNFCKAVSLKEQETFYNFVYEWKNLYNNGVLFSWEGKTSGIKNLLFDSFVTNYHIAQPPIGLMEQFFDYASSVDRKIQLLLKQNQELTQLRDWLLPMLMNGQVKVE